MITILSSSTRANSESRRVSEYFLAALKKMKVEARIVDLFELKLPVYDDSGAGEWHERWQHASQILTESDGYIFVTPEWDGMMSVRLLNFFHYIEKELADKPVLPVGVSSGRGGRYPLAQLRALGYKNKRFVLIPESLFFDHIGESLVDGVFTDPRTTERVDYALAVLLEYSQALAQVRQSGIINYEKFPNGL